GLEPIATVGVVLHLADVQADAKLTVDPRPDGPEKAEVVALKDVLAGKTVSLWDGTAAVRRVSTASPVVTDKTEDDFPAAAYGPDGTLWLAYISYTVKEDSRRIEAPQLKEQPRDFKAFNTSEFGDQLFVKYFRNDKWSEPIAVTDAKQDLVRCAIAVEGNGDAWVLHSAHRQGRHEIYARPVSPRFNPAGVANPPPRPGPEQKLTEDPGPNLNLVVCTDESGHLRGSYQTWRKEGEAMFGLLNCQQGKWTTGLEGGLRIPSYYFGGRGTNWGPASAAGPNGEIATAYDVYENGDHDVGLHVIDDRSARNSRAASTSQY